ncbi:tRNA glutamyl-Q(34) synthetase GluQRS, partial [Pseudomonas mosselii]|nr:tRNA glutamyl-Q(34) synthetase GluQRS [Pseudomonas mosselii]
LLRALRALGQQADPALAGASPREVLAAARQQWRPEQIARQMTVPEAQLR